MSDETKPQDSAAMSPASAGSVGEVLAKGIADIIRIAAQPDWIPVTERLPDEGGVFPYVLAKIGGMHYPAIARRSESTSGWVELGDLRLFAAWEITHWMPLPAPPADGE